MSEEEIAEQMHDNPLHWAEKYTKLQAESECGAFDHCGCKDKVAKLQAVLKDIAYSGIHMTVGEIRERALDAIKEVESDA